MNAIFRRLIASAAVVLGLLIVYMELAHGEDGERWFWIVIAGLATMLGMVELMSRAKPLE